MAPGRDDYNQSNDAYLDDGQNPEQEQYQPDQEGVYDQSEAPPGGEGMGHGAGMLPNINLPVMVALGRSFMSIHDILKLKPGQILELNKSPNEPVDLVVNGKVVARGELVDVDGRLAVRLIKITE